MKETTRTKEKGKRNASYKFLLSIILDSIIKASKNYYIKTFLEECQYEIQKITMQNLLYNELEPSSSDDETDSDSDNEESKESNNE